MRYFIFDYTADVGLVDSFLDAASLAHKQEKKTKEWFYWKFRNNPFGEAILACAEEDGIIAGCVAIGIQNFIINGVKFRGGLSFETFTHPSYQNKGLFKTLIKNAEVESIKRDLKFLLNFPNNNSLPGFLRMQWVKVDIAEYWIKGKNIATVLINYRELKKGFIPGNANIEEIKQYKTTNFVQSNKDYCHSEINSDYLNWRFFTFPNSEYAVINDENCISVGRVGHRGILKEVQVLFVNPKENVKLNFRKVLQAYKTKTKYDIISVPVSSANSIHRYFIPNLFVKVPNRGNVCYKMLDNSSRINFSNLSMNAINYHTY